MKPLRLHVSAGREVREAMDFYDDQQPRLGDRCEKALYGAMRKIRRNPAIGRVETPKARKYRLKDFPYYIVFENRREYIYVLAVAHQRRRPDYWKERT